MTDIIIFHYNDFSFWITLHDGSNMTGTNLYVNKCKQSRSYLNHLVYYTGFRGQVRSRSSGAWRRVPKLYRKSGTFLLYFNTSDRKDQNISDFECHTPVFLNRRVAARYRDLAWVIPGREGFSWNLSF